MLAWTDGYDYEWVQAILVKQTLKQVGLILPSVL
jgi:hypothetical protein